MLHNMKLLFLFVLARGIIVLATSHLKLLKPPLQLGGDQTKTLHYNYGHYESYGNIETFGTYDYKAFIEWKTKCSEIFEMENYKDDEDNDDDENEDDDDDDVESDEGIQTRITGGNLAEQDMFPYQAGLLLLQPPNVVKCGGVLISENFILTAAHCLKGTILGTVYLGSNQYADKETSAFVDRVTWKDFIIFESYLLSRKSPDDIALINLTKSVAKIPSVQPINLPEKFMTQDWLEEKIVTISGWGLTSDNATTPNNLLYYVDVEVLPQIKCTCSYLPGLIQNDKHICTDGSKGRSGCDGDSGGPLSLFYNGSNYLIGITVFGSIGGCEIGFPSVFMRITNYLDWIRRNSDIQKL